MIRILQTILTITLFSFAASSQDTSAVVETKPVPKVNIFQVDLGIGMGLYQAFDNISHGSSEGINAAANLSALKLSYTVNKLGFGVEAKIQKFITDIADTNNIITEATGGAIQLHTDYHYSYKNKFNAWLGAGFGVGSFRYTRSYRDSTTRISGTVQAAGPSLSLNSGFRWYFLKFMGFQVSATYAIYPMRYKSFTINGVSQETISYRPIDEAFINLRGPEIKAGLCFRF